MDLRKPLAGFLILIIILLAVGVHSTSPDQDRGVESDIEDTDFDNDGLNNSYENEIGTSPYNADTDGDNLLDSWEVNTTNAAHNLPNSSPLHKDVYLQLNYAENVTDLNQAEIKQLRAYWEEMPVENPDGKNGITLHIDDEHPAGGDISTNISLQGMGLGSISSKEVHSLGNRYYGGEGSVDGNISSKRRCVYHLMIMVQGRFPHGNESASNLNLGRSIGGGKFSIVMGDTEKGSVLMGPKRPSRLFIITHELLHNIAGANHTKEPGWLAGNSELREPRMSNETKNLIDTHGFASKSCELE